MHALPDRAGRGRGRGRGPHLAIDLRRVPPGAVGGRDLAARIPALAGREVSVLIWTTTPWTIPSNLAVAFHPDFDYGAYAFDGRVVVLASDLAGTVGKATGKPLGDPIVVVKGEVFDRLAFQHPLYDRPSVDRRARRLRHPRGRHRRRPHRARPRLGRLHDRRPLRPGRLRPGRTGRPLHGRRAGCSPACRSGPPTRRSRRRCTSAPASGIAPSSATAIRTAGDATTRRSSAPRRSGSSRWTRIRVCRRPHAADAGSRVDPRGAVDPGLGRRSNLQHDCRAPGLVHLAPAQLGCSDHRVLLRWLPRAGDRPQDSRPRR